MPILFSNPCPSPTTSGVLDGFVSKIRTIDEHSNSGTASSDPSEPIGSSRNQACVFDARDSIPPWKEGPRTLRPLVATPTCRLRVGQVRV